MYECFILGSYMSDVKLLDDGSNDNAQNNMSTSDNDNDDDNTNDDSIELIVEESDSDDYEH